MTPFLLATLLLQGPPTLLGEPATGLTASRVAEVVRFNRAEGLSLGAGVLGRVAPFVWAGARARYAFGDERVQGLVGLRRDEAASRIEIAVFAEMRDADPLALGLPVTNTITSLLLSHDDGSYVYAEGGQVQHRRRVGDGAELVVSVGAARESAPRATTRSGLFGDFQPNTLVRPGTYATAGVSLSGGEDDTEWFAGGDFTGMDASRGRAWAGGAVRRDIGSGLDVAVGGWAGVGGGDAMPQRDFRLGGARTMRGYEPGAFQGRSAWTIGVDLGLAHRVISPVLFVDAGQAWRPAPASPGSVQASAGAGVSVFRGILRAHVATPLERSDWRFDLMFVSRR